jgi:hypothetical protein
MDRCLRNSIDEMAYIIASFINLYGDCQIMTSNPAIKAKIAELDAAVMQLVDIPLEYVMPLPIEDLFNADDDELTAPVDIDLPVLNITM